MKKYLILVYIILVVVYNSKSQNSVNKVKHHITKELNKRITDKSWSITTKVNEITIQFVDTFFIYNSLSPIRRGINSQPDTLKIKIALKNNWSEPMRDSLRKINHSLIEPLINKYIAHYDSLNWRFMKSNRSMFLQSPYSDLKFWSGLNTKERESFNKITILPDTIIRNVGVFVSSDYQPAYLEIEPEDVNNRIRAACKSFTQELGRGSIVKSDILY